MHPTNHLAAVILAAGASSRFGEDNKLYAQLPNGMCIVERVLELVAGTAFGHRLIVCSRNDEVLPRLAESLSIQCIVNEQPRHGLGSSIARGICSLDASQYSGAAIFLGDMPFIKAETVASLAIRFMAEQCSKIIRPSYQGQPGHPVLFPTALFGELGRLNGDQGAMLVVRQNSNSLCNVSTEDTGVVRDVDTPEDFIGPVGS